MNGRRPKSPASTVTIRRMIAAAEKSGLPVTSIEVKPDGSVVVRTMIEDGKDDEFSRWEDRL